MVRHTKRNAWALLGALVALALPAAGEQRVSHWRDFHVADGLPDDLCLSVSIGPHGKVWAGHPRTGFITGMDGYSITNIAVPGPFSGRAYESPGGQLWVACLSGLKEFRDEKWTEFAVPEIAAVVRGAATNGGTIVPLCPVRSDRLLFLLPGALMQLDIQGQGRARVSPVPLLSASQTKLGEFLGMTTSARDGTLWIAGRHGLAHAATPARGLRPESEWKEYSPPEYLYARNLMEPVEDADGVVMVVAESTTNDQKIALEFDGQNWEPLSVGNESIRRAWRGPDKHYWIATADALFRLEGHRDGTLADESLAHQYFDLAMEPGGLFWLATSDGLFRYSPPTWQESPGHLAPDTSVKAIARDQEGNLWIATPDSLEVLWNEQWSRLPFPENHRPDLASAHTIYALADGSVVLPADGGLLQASRQGGRVRFQSQPQTRLRPVGLLNDGTLCLQAGSPDQRPAAPALDVFDGTNFSSFPAPPATFGNDLLAVPSTGGGLWLAGSNGVVRYQDQKWQGFGTPEAGLPEGLACIAEVSEGSIWCAIRQKIYEYDGKTWQLKQVAPGKVNTILAARDNSIWAATDGGIYRYHKQAWILNDTEEGLPSETVLSVGEDAAGRILAGTTHGLSLYVPAADPVSARSACDYRAGGRQFVPRGFPSHSQIGGPRQMEIHPRLAPALLLPGGR